jgi:hypothetical protein
VGDFRRTRLTGMLISAARWVHGFSRVRAFESGTRCLGLRYSRRKVDST